MGPVILGAKPFSSRVIAFSDTPREVLTPDHTEDEEDAKENCCHARYA